MFQEKFFVMPALNDATDRNMARGLSLALERKKETEMAERAKNAQRTEVDIASERRAETGFKAMINPTCTTRDKPFPM
jgi:hypothetical protein